jgi:transcriptional regulator with XRE-family HTH domain
LLDAEQSGYLTPLQRFGVEVRAVRQGRKITQKSLATYSGYTEAYVSRIETGTLKPSEEFAKKCDSVFQTNGLFARLRERIELGDHPSWFAPYADLEKDATAILNYSTTLVSGMLQTPEYAEAIFQARYPCETTAEIRAKVEARMRRRTVMDRECPPRLWAILYEGCLRARIGGLDVMRNQISRLLIETEELPHLTLQVLPFDAGAPPATDSFTVLRFSRRPDIVYVDSTFTGQVIESVATVKDATETYDQLRAAALHPKESQAVLRRIIKEFDQ